MRTEPAARTPRSTTARRLLALVLAVSALLLGPLSARAGGPQAEPWSVIESEHFRLSFHESTAAIAPDVSRMCEQAHDALVPVMGHAPDGPTEVVLLDGSDSANGSASVIPRNAMFLLAMPPEADSVLGDYDNWMWTLIVHEYSHILHLDTMGAIPHAANLPFGKRFAPNQLLPRWLVEGVATCRETRQTGSGRIVSAFFDMELRTALLSDSVPDIGQLSGSPLNWPQATGWYLYGSHFVDWIAETRGWDAWTEFFGDYGRRLLPYGLNVIARRTFGADFVTLWSEFLAAARGRALAEEIVRGVLSGVEPTPRVTPVTGAGFLTRFVTVDPSSARVAWVRVDGHRSIALVVADPSGEPALSIRLDSGGEVAFLPDGDAILAQASPSDGYYSFNDLWRLDPRTGARERMTWGARAREPAVSPDRRTIAFVSPVEGRTDLRLLDMETGEVRTLSTAGPWAQFGTPEFLDDTSLVATYLEPGRGRDLVRVDARTGEWVRLTDDRAMELDPAMVPGGEFLIFSSDRDHTSNLYVLRLADGEVRRLTRERGGAFSPAALSRADGGTDIWFSRYGPTGFDIARTELGAGLFDSLPPAPDSYRRRDPILPELDVPVPPSEPYRGLLRARPLRWGPFAQQLSGGTTLGLLAWGGDPAGQHTWVGTVAWPFAEELPIGTVGWTTTVLYPSLTVSLSRGLQTRERSLVRDSEWVPFLEQSWSATGEAQLPFRRLDSSHGVGVSWTVERATPLAVPSSGWEPTDTEPRSPQPGRWDAVGLTWGWANVERYAYSVSAERGSALGLSLRLRSRALGATADGSELTAGWRQFVPIPWWPHHVVGAHVSAGAGTSTLPGRTPFVVGGLGGHDLFVSLVQQTPAGTGHVRGYRPAVRFGNRFWMGHLEYRAPLVDIDRGFGTLPLYLGRVHFALFVDAGDAGTRVLDPADALVGAGAELRVDSVIGYFRGADFRAGLARGLGDEGITDVYFLYGGGF